MDSWVKYIYISLKVTMVNENLNCTQQYLLVKNDKMQQYAAFFFFPFPIFFGCGPAGEGGMKFLLMYHLSGYRSEIH